MNISQAKNSILFKSVKFPTEKLNMGLFHEINTNSHIQPEWDLITFYLATHAINEFDRVYGDTKRLNKDQEQVLNTLVSGLNKVFHRMFSYVMLISVGESRHGDIDSKHDEIKNLFGEDILDFALSINGTNRSNSRHEFLQSDRDILRYMTYCDWNFNNCFTGGSFGGKKWFDISNKCTQVLSGEVSPYVMVDMSWAMVHNTGSIFNKNTIYNNVYSWNALLQILDMQRGGAIPALITHHEYYKSKGLYIPNSAITQEHKSMLEDIKVYFDLPDIDAIIELPVVADAGAISDAIVKHKAKSKIVSNSEDIKYHQNGVLNMGLCTVDTLGRN